MSLSNTSYSETVLITGGSSGVGLCAAKSIAEFSPKTLVVVASRSSPEGSLPSNIKWQKLDLTSRASVRSFVSSWDYGPLRSLVLNAGMSPVKAPTFTSDGIEEAFAVNHQNQALLFFLLKEKNALGPDCRIILVGSAMHDPKAPLSPAAPYWTSAELVARAAGDKKNTGDGIRYANSKLAVQFFAYALARRVERSGQNWTVNVFEPGFMPGQGSKLTRGQPAAIRFIVSHIIPHMLWIFRMFGTVTSSPPVSGKALMHMVTGDDFKDVSGKYILIHSERPSSEDSYDVEKQDDLWDYTVKVLAISEEEKISFETM